MRQNDTAKPDVETASANYASRFDGPVGQFLLDAQSSAIARLLRSDSSGPVRVLEVGGGHGQLTPLLLEQDSFVWVHGSNATCAERITPLVSENGGRLCFFVATLWSMPFSDQCFDVVIGIRLLAHVEQWQELLLEMSRVSRHRLVVDYPPLVGVNALQPWLLHLKQRIEANTRPYYSHTTARLIRVLRQAGFCRFTVEKQFFLPMALHRALRSPRFSNLVEAICRKLGLTGLFGGPAILLAERETPVLPSGRPRDGA